MAHPTNLYEELQNLAGGLQIYAKALEKHDDTIADVATSGDITYIRLALLDVVAAIGCVDPEKLKKVP